MRVIENAYNINARNTGTKAVFMAISAAVLYGLSAPASKLLLVEIRPSFMAALLYLGAGAGMLAVSLFRGFSHSKQREAKITNKEIPLIIAMVLLDIAAPILIMYGLSLTTAENVSLLNNFEIVTTSIIALIVFKEAIGKRMWLAISLITAASILLTVSDFRNITFSSGSLLVIAGCLCWGFENNCTRMLSIKDPIQIVTIKGLGSGIGSLIIAVALNAITFNIIYIIMTLILGFIAYGLSIYLYIKSQRYLGAARTSAYYAAAPFIGVLISVTLLMGKITPVFLIALIVMIVGTYFVISENHKHMHIHNEVTHEHIHNHHEGHHNHNHINEITGVHSHMHKHETLEHYHVHTPEIHHRHSHK